METLLNLGLALALGLLVGVERGWQEREAAEGRRLAGIRTFGLISLLGGLCELLSRGSGELFLGIAFLAFVVLMAVAHVAEARASHDLRRNHIDRPDYIRSRRSFSPRRARRRRHCRGAHDDYSQP